MDAGEGLGSGVVWPDGLGHVVTNYHVVKSIVSDFGGSKARRLLPRSPTGLDTHRSTRSLQRTL